MGESSAGAKPFLRILLGPTASGKESAAVACAKMIGGEIVSVDSMKIYRTLDIGTAKASEKIRADVPHHCLDIADPEENFSVGRYVEEAEKAIVSVVARGKVPILSGGTALYYKGLLEGLFDGPSADADLREEFNRRAETEGVEKLYAELAEVDPQAAEKIHPNDLRRIVRALEVAKLTGQPISSQQTQWVGAEYRYPCALAALDWPREVLYARIEKRVDLMMAEGLLEEARQVYEKRDYLSRTPLQAVGYKEFFSYFSGETDLAEAVELLKKNTRNLAKSQMTWFRKFPCEWIAMDEKMNLTEVVEKSIAAWSRQLQ
jgi:tRNA dimethylallyltransferase